MSTFKTEFAIDPLKKTIVNSFLNPVCSPCALVISSVISSVLFSCREPDTEGYEATQLRLLMLTLSGRCTRFSIKNVSSFLPEAFLKEKFKSGSQ